MLKGKLLKSVTGFPSAFIMTIVIGAATAASVSVVEDVFQPRRVKASVM